MNACREKKLSVSFKWLNGVQFLGALNDNLFKLFVVFSLIGLYGPEKAAHVSAVAGAVFVLPFLLFMVPAGNLADRWSKRSIVVAAKWAEVLIMTAGCLCFSLGSGLGLYAVLFLMSVQSAFFGPSKMGIIPELVGRDALSRANGWLTMCTFLAIVAGSALAPMLGELSGKVYSQAQLVCIGVALAGALAAHRVQKTPAAGVVRRTSLFFLKDLVSTLRFIRRDGYLFLAVLASAYFMLIGAFLQLNIIPFGMQELGLSQERSGYLFFVAAIGIAAGSWLSGRLSGRDIEFGIVPIGALMLTLSILTLNHTPSNLAVVVPRLVLAGVGAGLFIVPLDAFIQFRAPRQQLGQVIAAAGFLSWVGVLAASGLMAAFSWMGLSATAGFHVMGWLTLGLTVTSFIVLPDFFFRFAALVVTRVAYRVRVIGRENLPVEGPALLICNHVTYLDAFLLSVTTRRRIRFIMAQDVYESLRFAQPFLRLMGAIPLPTSGSPKKMVEALRRARAAMDDGYLVCIFAEGMLTRTGTLREFRRGFERITKGTGYPIIPMYLGGAWGSIASYYHGQLVRRWPGLLRYPVSVLIGKPLPSTVTAPEVKDAVMQLSCDYFEDRKWRRRTLAEEWVRVVRRRWSQPAMQDTQGYALTHGKSLVAALALKRSLMLRVQSTEPVGIVLPASVGAVLANMAVMLAKRMPIHLNYTASSSAFESAIRQSGIRVIITSRAFTNRVPIQSGDVEWIYLEDCASALTRWDKIAAFLQAVMVPARRLARPAGFSADDTAGILFSSGSTGMPKGVMLTHHNIMSNIEALRMVFCQSPKDHLCSALPFFHSLGFTATLWYPVLSGLPVMYHPNPLDASGMIRIIREQPSTLLFATPTFLSLYLRKAEAEDFRSLRYVVVGAERMRPGLADAWEARFGMRPLEGYGATELSPVAALSLPHVTVGGVTQSGWKEDCVGMPLPGLAVRIVDPESGAPIPNGESGLLLVKGPNVMKGYLNQPEQTADVLREGWYNTGDIARMDDDGFILITDRLARFSKIGGEMVPHVAVEDALHQALGAVTPVLAVTAVPDEQRGERLVVLYAPEAGPLEKLMRALRESELPNLWKPAADQFHAVECLPVLGTGKLDLAALKALAVQCCSRAVR